MKSYLDYHYPGEKKSYRKSKFHPKDIDKMKIRVRNEKKNYHQLRKKLPALTSY